MIKSPLVVVALALVACQACLGADEITKERFLKEYQAALPRLKASYEQVRISGIYTSRVAREVDPRPPRAGLAQESPLEFASWHSGGREKQYIRAVRRVAPGGKPNGIHTVIVLDGEQSFCLRRADDDPAFHLTSKPIPEALRRQFNRFRDEVVSTPFTMIYVDVDTIIHDESFRVESVSTAEREGRKLYKATFVYHPVGQTIANISGWFTVDPKHMFVIDEYEVLATSTAPKSFPMSMRVRNNYDFTGETPKPSRIESNSTVLNKDKATRILTFESKSWDFQETPAKEFTLEAYGVNPTDPPLGNNAAARGVK